MPGTTRRTLALYVDRATRSWIVRDPEGKFWIVSTGPDAWERREPFVWSDNTELSPVPGHYMYLLQLPFDLE